MRVGIDFSRGEMEHRTGVEWYSYNIVKHLLDLGAEHEIILYSRRGGNPASTVHLRWPFRFGWTQFRLSLEMLLHPPDVLFVPSHILPPITPKRVVTMAHDVAFRRHPEWYSQKQIRVLELGIRRIIKKRAVVLVPTEFVKQELLALYPVMRDLDIHVVHHGIDQKIFTPRDAVVVPPLLYKERVGERWLGEVSSLSSGSYFLFVGRLEHKKNISRIVDAFVEFVGASSPKVGGGGERSGVIDSDVETGLVLVGNPGHGYEEFANKLNHPNIRVIPSVLQEELVVLYQNAIALVFPTLYEGCGMPILEAMACGCPVITSKGGAHQEVAGDSAVFVDSESVGEIARGLRVFLDDESRIEFIQKGYTRAQEFSWDGSARKTMDTLTKEI